MATQMGSKKSKKHMMVWCIGTGASTAQYLQLQ
jgi:hypothetical protein